MKNKKLNKNKIIFLSLVLIIASGFTVYFNSLNGKFIYDDDVLVKDNLYIRNWHNLPKVLTKDIGSGGAKEYHFYRPVQTLTYMIDYSLWKLNVRGYHLTNILLHILAALAIYWLIFLLYKDWLISFFTGLLFMVHPVHTEAVVYISGRADLLAALFMLLCLIFYIKYLRSKNIITYAVILFTYSLAILSKEYCLVFPVLLLLYHYVFKVKLKIKIILPILLIIVLYVILRLTTTSISLLFNPAMPSGNLFQRIPGVFSAIATYIRILILPVNLHMEYGRKFFNFTDPKVILGFLIFVSLLILIFRNRKNKDLTFFSISWLFIALLPQTNIFSLNAYMAEHWLYLPSLGFFLILAGGLSYLYRTKNLRILAVFFFISLTVFYSILTVRQNNYWKDPIVFYERTLKYAPDSWKILNNLGRAYKDKGNFVQAEALYKKALIISPSREEIYNNLGLLYHDNGKYPEAIVAYKKAVEINPKEPRTYNNLGNTYKEIGKPGEAIALYKKAIEINPDYVDAYNNLGIVSYTLEGEKEKSIEAFQKVIEINPDDADAHNNLAVAYYYKGRCDLAKKHCQKAINLGYKVNPKFLKLIINCRK